MLKDDLAGTVMDCQLSLKLTKVWASRAQRMWRKWALTNTMLNAGRL